MRLGLASWLARSSRRSRVCPLRPARRTPGHPASSRARGTARAAADAETDPTPEPEPVAAAPSPRPSDPARPRAEGHARRPPMSPWRSSTARRCTVRFSRARWKTRWTARWCCSEYHRRGYVLPAHALEEALKNYTRTGFGDAAKVKAKLEEQGAS